MLFSKKNILRINAIVLLTIVSSYFFQQSIHLFSHSYHNDSVPAAHHDSNQTDGSSTIKDFSKKVNCIVCDNIFKVSPFSLNISYCIAKIEFLCKQFIGTESKIGFQLIWNIASRGPPSNIL